MLDDIPDLSGDDVDWPPDWDAAERVHAITDVIRQPRTAEWIADEADVDEATARQVLDSLVEEDSAFQHDADGYRWDTEELRRQTLEELREQPDDELRRELEEVEQELDERRERHAVDSSADLDDAEAAYDWQMDLQYRDLVKEALNR